MPPLLRSVPSLRVCLPARSALAAFRQPVSVVSRASSYVVVRLHSQAQLHRPPALFFLGTACCCVGCCAALPSS